MTTRSAAGPSPGLDWPGAVERDVVGLDEDVADIVGHQDGALGEDERAVGRVGSRRGDGCDEQERRCRGDGEARLSGLPVRSHADLLGHSGTGRSRQWLGVVLATVAWTARQGFPLQAMTLGGVKRDMREPNGPVSLPAVRQDTRVAAAPNDDRPEPRIPAGASWCRRRPRRPRSWWSIRLRSTRHRRLMDPTRRMGRRIPTQLLESASGLVLAVASAVAVLGHVFNASGLAFVTAIVLYMAVRQTLLCLRLESRAFSWRRSALLPHEIA
jgi:hypothetical protein